MNQQGNDINDKTNIVKKFLLDEFSYTVPILDHKHIDECYLLIDAMTKPNEYIHINHRYNNICKLVYLAYLNNFRKLEPTNLRNKEVITSVIYNILYVYTYYYPELIKLINSDVHKEILQFEFVNNFEYVTSLECACGVSIEEYLLHNYVNFLRKNKYENVDDFVLSLYRRGIKCDYTYIFDKCDDKNIDLYKKLVNDTNYYTSSWGTYSFDALVKLTMYHYEHKMYDIMSDLIDKGMHMTNPYTKFKEKIDNIDYVQHYVKYLAGIEDNEQTYLTNLKYGTPHNNIVIVTEDKYLKYAVKLYRENEILKN